MHPNGDWETMDGEDDSAKYSTRIIDVYRNVKDIDLYTGGLAETAVSGAVIGPTFLVNFSTHSYFCFVTFNITKIQH